VTAHAPPSPLDLTSLKALQAFREEPRLFLELFCYIRGKDRRSQLIRLNPMQEEYYQHRAKRNIILKPRQVGSTTINALLFLADTLLHGNTYSAIVAHNAESAESIFEIVQFAWAHLPDWWHSNHPPARSSRSELYWPSLNSRYYVGTAGSPSFGRGQTINNLLCSEVAHWRKADEVLASLLAAVPEGGCVVLESTPNGVGTHFYDLWHAADREESDFRSHFYVWWEDPTYRLAGPPLGALSPEERDLRARYGLDDDQLRWRRRQSREMGGKFIQEYPEDPESCFLANGACCFSTAALVAMRQRAVREQEMRTEAPLAYHRWYQGGRSELGLVNPLPGRLSIWRQPQPDRSYAIGADVAAGLESGNCSAAVVLDRGSGEQVAELHGRWRPDVFAQLLAALGAMYHLSVLAVESNNHGGTALHVLRHELCYRRLYYHVDRLRQSRQSRPELGWPTTTRTKPMMIDQLAAAIAEGRITIRSPWLIDECLTFVNRDGELGAEEGKLDDLVIAAAIAWAVSQQPVARGSSQRPPGW
jgi:hypothetical protein